MTRQLKDLIKAHRILIPMNLTGFECPECCKKYKISNYPVRAQILRDEKYHKYKFYLKCKDCGLVTPAYEDLKKLIEVWEDIWINEEIKTVGVENE